MGKTEKDKQEQSGSKQEGAGVLPSWSSKMKELGGGDFTFLSTDGETITFIVVGGPQLIKTTYQKKEQERIGCPVVTEDGYVLFICGKRVARKLTKREKEFASHAIMVVRHGVEGDQNARYDVAVLPEKATYDRLAAIRDADFTEDMIADSVADAQKTLGT